MCTIKTEKYLSFPRTFFFKIFKKTEKKNRENEKNIEQHITLLLY